MKIKSKKRAIFFMLPLVFLLLPIVPSTVCAQSDMLTIRFHSSGEGKNVTINLMKYLPVAKEYVHSEVQNVDIIMLDKFATIIPKIGWVGSEVITFSSNRTVIEDVNKGLVDIEDLTNLEPIIEMSFPSPKEFGVSPGHVEFTVIAYDPDNDMLTVEWLVNGEVVQTERSKGGIISHFTFNETTTKKAGGILKGHVFNEKLGHYIITSIINDSREYKVLEWQFNVVNQTCSDYWQCNNWSECIGGKRYRPCKKINSECDTISNKPATEWIDPTCITPTPNCVPKWKCGEWEDCKLDYDVRLVSSGMIENAIKTKQERLCHDAAYCTGATGIETRGCGKEVLVKTREVTWCNQPYIEIFNYETGQFISRIKKYKLGGRPSLDIDLTVKELKQEDYCWYCYNGEKDYDEIEVDCGGSCMECIKVSLKVELVDIFKFSLFLLVDLILIIYVFVWIKSG